MDRLSVLFNLVGNGETFADVGCDHGYIAEMVLKSNKFEKVIISDISDKSLQKAVELLKPYGDRVTAIVSDGFENYETLPDEVMIAGMGGEEIVKILYGAKSLPKSLVLAPQKNSDKVRRFLILLGYKILKDFTFKDKGKFYDAIKAVEACEEQEEYSLDEYLFGRDNLREMPQDFKEKIALDIKTLEAVIVSSASETSKEKAREKVEKLREILK